MKKYIILSLLLCCCIFSRSQTSEGLNAKLKQFRQVNPTAFLFLHHDKGIYTTNEKIWFGAYLLHTPNPMKEHKVLTVILLNEQTKKAGVQQKFKLTDGLSSGFVLLPDSMPPGDYQLTAYTNVLNAKNLPIAVYTASIKVLDVKQQKVTSKLTLLDSVVKNGLIRAVVDISGLDAKKKSLVVVNYGIDGGALKTVKVEGNKALVNIPAEELGGPGRVLQVKVQVDAEVQYLSKTLARASPPDIEVKFYPEGGSLVTGLESRVGWEARTNDGRPVKLRGMLLKNNQAVAEVSTNAYGMGSFAVRPEPNSSYSLKLAPGHYFSKELRVELPEHSTTGEISVHIAKAVVNDSLGFVLSTTKAKQIFILLHNTLGDYVVLKGQANTPVKKFSLPLKSLPKGLTTLTIADESGKPLVERLFFAHYEQQDVSAKIQMEKMAYAKGDSVRIRLKLTGRTGQPVQGILSTSVLQNNRITFRNADIENYFYLNRTLGDLPFNPSGNGLLDRDYLEDILLIKGWKNYNQNISGRKDQDTTFFNGDLTVKGAVLNGKAPLKKSVDLVAFGGIKPSLITTNPDGTFLLSLEDQLAEKNRNIFLRTNADKGNYAIKIYDSFMPATGALTNKVNPAGSESLNNEQEDSIVKSLQRVISLDDVQIIARRSNILPTGAEKGANACGDFVDNTDEYGILNYEGTPLEYRRKPIPNRVYLKRTDLQGSYFRVDRVFYTGCLTAEEQKATSLAGINSGQEFDMYMDHDDSGTAYRSTLFWRSGMIVGPAGELEFSFKAGEVADSFSVVVQGISNMGLVNVKGSFQVR